MNDTNKYFIEYSEYFYMLDDFNTIPKDNYTLDKVYDKEWFINDLIKIIEHYNDHLSKHTLIKDLMLWSSFLHGIKQGKYI